MMGREHMQQGDSRQRGGSVLRDGVGGSRFLCATHNGARFKTYELCISGVFHLMFLDHGWQVTETMDRNHGEGRRHLGSGWLSGEQMRRPGKDMRWPAQGAVEIKRAAVWEMVTLPGRRERRRWQWRLRRGQRWKECGVVSHALGVGSGVKVSNGCGAVRSCP